MKKYRSYKANKFRLPRRIIFFSVVAVVILVLAVIWGNVLKDRLESTPRDTTDILTTTDPSEDNSLEDDVPSENAVHDEAYRGVSAGYLDLTAAEDEAGARAAVGTLWEKGFNAACFVVTDEGGMITYASPSIESFSRLPASEELVPYELLSEAVREAKSMGMRASAVMTATEGLTDELLAAELFELGFDELIIRGFEEYTQLDNEKVSVVSGYISKLRDAAEGMVFSLSFADEFYKAPSNAPYIEKIYANVEFLSIDMTGMSPEETGAAVDEMTGSFSAYLLRPLLSGTD
ncbi:MAG: hypothetical protein IJD22_01920, partial [Clostridia bacterium]|nr:hypothetical protein [Clostridia bacterium]